MHQDDTSDRLVLESVVTSVDSAGNVNVAPMGPIVNRDLTEIVLRPFTTSRTFANLKATGRAVVHVTDDVMLIARGAIGRIDPLPPMHTIDDDWWVLDDCNRWFAIEVDHWTGDEPRESAQCRIRNQGVGRAMFGLNRAKAAVVEAAIIATRTHLLPPEEMVADMERLDTIVRKTGGKVERNAFQLLQAYVDEHLPPIG